MESRTTLVRVAIAGAGPMAREHARAFAATPGMTVAGICSRTRVTAEALAAQFPGCMACGSVEDLHATTQADILLVAVPPLAVRDVCAAAFKFPWLCLIEKPAGYNVAEAEEIAGWAERERRRAYLALNRRHYSCTRAVLADLENALEPRLLQVYDQADPASRVADRPLLVRQTWMYANSIHIADYLRIFGRGRITKVERTIPFVPEEPRFVAAKIEFSSGDIGLYTAIWNGPGPWAASITTQKKRWELRPLERAGVQTHPSRAVTMFPVHPWDEEFKPGLRLQAEETLKALRGESTALPTLADGLETMRLMQAIYGV